MKILFISVTIVLLTITTAFAQKGQGPSDTKPGMEARKEAFMEKYDTNQDGVLSEKERLVARETMQANRGPRPGMNPERRKQMMKQWDVNEDGELSPEEREAARDILQQRRARILKRFDANGDGTLDEAERQAVQKAIQKRRTQKGKPE